MQRFALIAVFLISATLIGNQCHAQVAALPIKIKGEIALDDENISSPVNFGTGAIAGSLRLFLIVDMESNVMSLVTADDDSIVEMLACSTRCAFVASGQFEASLCYPNLLISNDAFTKLGNGSMQLWGKIKTDSDTGEPISISGRIFGVYNDSINGNDTQPDMLMKATFKPAGAVVDAEELGWFGDECDSFDCDTVFVFRPNGYFLSKRHVESCP